MKTLYEKAQNFCNYVIDIMYMQRYYLDCYSTINVMMAGRNTKMLPSSHMDRVRGYSFDCNNPDEGSSIQFMISRKDDYKIDSIQTITSSYAHIRRNTAIQNRNYHFVLQSNVNVIDCGTVIPVYNKMILSDLMNAIEEGTVQETEFQLNLLHSDYDITKLYFVILLNEHLENIQYIDRRVCLCLGSTDIRTFIPAKKAMVDLLNERAPHEDWRDCISKRYGHTVK